MENNLIKLCKEIIRDIEETPDYLNQALLSIIKLKCKKAIVEEIDIPIEDIRQLKDYLYDDEEKHYNETIDEGNDVECHIFNSVVEVDEWLDSLEK